MSNLVSVIVPIYKVEKYLCQCIDSIIAQTYQNLEIILVDDGSPDGCGATCDEYAQNDSRIRVIHKENGGLSSARNVGLAAATGEYVMFVDSDDWIEPDSIQRLYEELVIHNAQMAIGVMQKIADGTNNILFSNYRGHGRTECCNKLHIMKEHLSNGGWSAWAKLYKMEIHRDVLFPVGEINEDGAIALQILHRCSNIVKVDTLVYNYRERADSICTSAFNESDLDWYKHCKADVQWIDERYPQLSELARLKMYTAILLHLSEIAVAPKRYHHLAQPLLEQVRIDYSEMRISLSTAGKSTRHLWMFRHLPYSFYCFMTRMWWRVRRRTVIGS